VAYVVTWVSGVWLISSGGTRHCDPRTYIFILKI